MDREIEKTEPRLEVVAGVRRSHELEIRGVIKRERSVSSGLVCRLIPCVCGDTSVPRSAGKDMIDLLMRAETGLLSLNTRDPFPVATNVLDAGNQFEKGTIDRYSFRCTMVYMDVKCGTDRDWLDPEVSVCHQDRTAFQIC